MAAPFASLEDIVKHRAVVVEQLPAVDDLLHIASANLRSKVRQIDERVASGDLDEWLPKGAVIRMVTEVLDNPQRVTSEQIEDAGFRFDAALVRRQMQPTADEVASMSPPAAKKRARSHHGVPCW